MNKDRFHNALAMALGYEQIVNDKRYNIIVDDKADEPKVVIEDADGCILLSFKASQAEKIKQHGQRLGTEVTPDIDIDVIVDAVNQAYKKSIQRY